MSSATDMMKLTGRLLTDFEHCFENHVKPHLNRNAPLHPESCWLCRNLVQKGGQ